MRHLNNFVGNSRGRNVVPSGICFGGSIYTDCSLDPAIYTNAYSVPTRVVGISNTFNLTVSGGPPNNLGEIVVLYYKVSSTQPTTPGPRSPPSSNAFSQVPLNFSGVGTISGITNGHWIQFGVEAIDTFSGTEFWTSTLSVSNVTPGITLGSFTWYNIC